MHPTSAEATALLHRWQRLQMLVRCGLRDDPACVRLYVQAGLQLARLGVRPTLTVQLQVLHTLLAAARDEALPWFWRSVCLEHVNLPLAKVTSCVGGHDPLVLQAIESAVQRARDALPALPRDPVAGKRP